MGNSQKKGGLSLKNNICINNIKYGFTLEYNEKSYFENCTNLSKQEIKGNINLKDINLSIHTTK